MMSSTPITDGEADDFIAMLDGAAWQTLIGDGPYCVMSFPSSGREAIIVEAVAYNQTGKAAEGRDPLRDDAFPSISPLLAGRSLIVVQKDSNPSDVSSAYERLVIYNPASISYVSKFPLQIQANIRR